MCRSSHTASCWWHCLLVSFCGKGRVSQEPGAGQPGRGKGATLHVTSFSPDRDSGVPKFWALLYHWAT